MLNNKTNYGIASSDVIASASEYNTTVRKLEATRVFSFHFWEPLYQLYIMN